MNSIKNKVLVFLSVCIFVGLMIVDLSLLTNKTASISNIGSLVVDAFAVNTVTGDLTCDDLSNCKDGAGCTGPGKMTGPCTMECDQGPKVSCGVDSEIGEN